MQWRPRRPSIMSPHSCVPTDHLDTVKRISPGTTAWRAFLPERTDIREDFCQKIGGHRAGPRGCPLGLSSRTRRVRTLCPALWRRKSVFTSFSRPSQTHRPQRCTAHGRGISTSPPIFDAWDERRSSTLAPATRLVIHQTHDASRIMHAGFWAPYKNTNPRLVSLESPACMPTD